MGYYKNYENNGRNNGNNNDNRGNGQEFPVEVSDRDYEKNKRKSRWEGKKARKQSDGDDYDPRDW